MPLDRNELLPLMQVASAELDRTMRQLFALANQHMRRELSDLARRLDEQPAIVELREGLVPGPSSN
jgi:RNA polymerase sigma-70 factor (ECF subfamily)